MKIDNYKLDCIEVEDINYSDYPDFCDAFISYAEYNGVALTDEELDEVNDDSDFVYETVLKRIY